MKLSKGAFAGTKFEISELHVKGIKEEVSSKNMLLKTESLGS